MAAPVEAALTETHVAYLEKLVVTVTINENGDVFAKLDVPKTATFDPYELAEIVKFVERHGEVTAH